MAFIHPTAILDPSVTLDENVSIGPYCVLSGNVAIGAGTKLVSHVSVSATGRTVIGEGCTVYPFASLGHPPQDLKYKGESSELVIGARTTIREHVTMNPGTEGGGLVTRVGEGCLFMVGAHVAHDCQVGNNVILANNATLAGHVTVGDHAIIGGLAAVHQFVRIGRHAIVGGMSGVEHDVIPYGSVMGERASLAGLNLVGLKRKGVERDVIHALRSAYRQLFDESEGTLAERAAYVKKEFPDTDAIAEIIAFVQEKSHRSLCVPSLSSPPPLAGEGKGGGADAA